MTRCDHCEKPILDELDTVWAPKFVCAATLSSPEEWDEVPLHRACYATVIDRDYQEHLDELKALRGLTDAERERI